MRTLSVVRKDCAVLRRPIRSRLSRRWRWGSCRLREKPSSRTEVSLESLHSFYPESMFIRPKQKPIWFLEFPYRERLSEIGTSFHRAGVGKRETPESQDTNIEVLT